MTHTGRNATCVARLTSQGSLYATQETTMRRPTHLTTLFSAAVVLALCLAGCDDGADPASASDEATPPVAPTEPVVAITTCDELPDVLPRRQRAARHRPG